MPDEPVQPQNGFGKQEHEIGANELNDQINVMLLRGNARRISRASCISAKVS